MKAKVLNPKPKKKANRKRKETVAERKARMKKVRSYKTTAKRKPVKRKTVKRNVSKVPKKTRLPYIAINEFEQKQLYKFFNKLYLELVFQKSIEVTFTKSDLNFLRKYMVKFS